MKKLMKKLEDIMVAVTFAEAGEYDEARKHSESDLRENADRPQEAFKKTALEGASK